MFYQWLSKKVLVTHQNKKFFEKYTIKKVFNRRRRESSNDVNAFLDSFDRKYERMQHANSDPEISEAESYCTFLSEYKLSINSWVVLRSESCFCTPPVLRRC